MFVLPKFELGLRGFWCSIVIAKNWKLKLHPKDGKPWRNWKLKLHPNRCENLKKLTSKEDLQRGHNAMLGAHNNWSQLLFVCVPTSELKHRDINQPRQILNKYVCFECVSVALLEYLWDTQLFETLGINSESIEKAQRHGSD